MEYLLHAVPLLHWRPGLRDLVLCGLLVLVEATLGFKQNRDQGHVYGQHVCLVIQCLDLAISKFLIPLILSADAYPPTHLLISNLGHDLDPCFVSLIGAAFLPIL